MRMAQTPRAAEPCSWEAQPAGCVRMSCPFHHTSSRLINGLFLPPTGNTPVESENIFISEDGRRFPRPIHSPVIITIGPDDESDDESEEEAENCGIIQRIKSEDELDEEKAIADICKQAGDMYEWQSPQEDVLTSAEEPEMAIEIIEDGCQSLEREIDNWQVSQEVEITSVLEAEMTIQIQNGWHTPEGEVYTWNAPQEIVIISAFDAGLAIPMETVWDSQESVFFYVEHSEPPFSKPDERKAIESDLFAPIPYGARGKCDRRAFRKPSFEYPQIRHQMDWNFERPFSAPFKGKGERWAYKKQYFEHPRNRYQMDFYAQRPYSTPVKDMIFRNSRGREGGQRFSERIDRSREYSNYNMNHHSVRRPYQDPFVPKKFETTPKTTKMEPKASAELCLGISTDVESRNYKSKEAYQTIVERNYRNRRTQGFRYNPTQQTVKGTPQTPSVSQKSETKSDSTNMEENVSAEPCLDTSNDLVFQNSKVKEAHQRFSTTNYRNRDNYRAYTNPAKHSVRSTHQDPSVPSATALTVTNANEKASAEPHLSTAVDLELRHSKGKGRHGFAERNYQHRENHRTYFNPTKHNGKSNNEAPAVPSKTATTSTVVDLSEKVPAAPPVEPATDLEVQNYKVKDHQRFVDRYYRNRKNQRFNYSPTRQSARSAPQVPSVNPKPSTSSTAVSANEKVAEEPHLDTAADLELRNAKGVEGRHKFAERNYHNRRAQRCYYNPTQQTVRRTHPEPSVPQKSLTASTDISEKPKVPVELYLDTATDLDLQNSKGKDDHQKSVQRNHRDSKSQRSYYNPSQPSTRSKHEDSSAPNQKSCHNTAKPTGRSKHETPAVPHKSTSTASATNANEKVSAEQPLDKTSGRRRNKNRYKRSKEPLENQTSCAQG